MVLAEKGLPWASHHVDLTKGEHATETYRRVNPNGLVPALVHDGVTVIESSDIMEYLDEQFPDPPLRPAWEGARAQMHQWVARQDSIQRPFEILSREFVAVPLEGVPGPGATRSTIAGAVRTVENALGEVNRHLEGRTWIVGDALSLADIAWVVDVHRLALMWFPMSDVPNLRAWYRRMRRLASFQQAVAAYEPPALRRRVHLYTLRRWLRRSHAGASRWRSARLLTNA
jgi:glutathione S-transferase